MNPVTEITEAAWATLQGDLGRIISDGVRGLLDGAEEDIRTFGVQMAEDMVNAIRLKDTAWQREIKAQASIILELNRLRAVNSQHALLMQVLHSIIEMGLKVARTFLGGLL